MGARIGLGLLLASLLLTGPAPASARPEKIRPGHPYYSDEAAVEGEVRDLVGEKNYEEVYQRYRYYEAVYDEAGRVVIFREYLRGEVVRTEEYRYDAQGGLRERVIRRPGGPAERRPVGEASPGR